MVLQRIGFRDGTITLMGKLSHLWILIPVSYSIFNFSFNVRCSMSGFKFYVQSQFSYIDGGTQSSARGALPLQAQEGSPLSMNWTATTIPRAWHMIHVHNLKFYFSISWIHTLMVASCSVLSQSKGVCLISLMLSTVAQGSCLCIKLSL